MFGYGCGLFKSRLCNLILKDNTTSKFRSLNCKCFPLVNIIIAFRVLVLVQASGLAKSYFQNQKHVAHRILENVILCPE